MTGATALVLASGSPRRARLLTAAGYLFTTISTDVDETPLVAESPRDLVRRLSAEKASAAGIRDGVVLAADTVVAIDGEILGKPADPADAVRMLRRLSARSHDVFTGWTVAAPTGWQSGVTRTVVEFRTLGADEIDTYVATGEPLDKAGAYAIQGGAAAFVVGFEGPRDNVIGLPLRNIMPVLERLGVVPVRPNRSSATATGGP